MTHLSDGVLRRMIDEPFAVSPADRTHVTECKQCRQRVEAISKDSALAAALLGEDPPSSDLNVARATVAQRAAGSTGNRLSFLLDMPRARLLPTVGTVAVAVALVTSIATGAASSLLSVFQPSQVVPIYITRGELSSLPALNHLGTFHRPGRSTHSQTFNSLEAAAEAAGVHVVVPGYLPSNIPAKVTYEVLPARQGWFTFRADRVAAYARRSGHSVPTLPAYLNHSRLSLATNAAVIAVYGAKNDIPALVIGQTKAPTLTVTGATLGAVESYLASIPGIPKSLVQQLQSLSSPNSSLPIPIPVDWAYAHHVVIDGGPGLLVGDDTGVASVVIWEKSDVVYGVGGALASSEVLKIAASLG